MTQNSQTSTADRVVIFANSNVSRGKYAAAAVHAALTAAGAHPGLPVIVLGAKPAEIKTRQTVIHDAGRTEVEPGTVTAGTDWDGAGYQARLITADDIPDDAADRAQIAFHEFTFGDDEPMTQRELGIARRAWKVAIAEALNT